MKSPVVLVLGVLCMTAACSSSSTPAADPPAPDAGHADAGRGGSSGKRDAGKDASAPADAGNADVNVTDAPFDASPFVSVDGGAGGAITGVPPQIWTWIPIPGAICRDGSATGIGVNLNPASSNVVIYLEGGGACFNILSCAENASSFAATDFAGRFPATDAGVPLPGNGILDRTNAANPVADWNFVYVPYCTGDIHGGNLPAGSVEDVAGTQAFVGYRNIDFDLQRIVPTFPNAPEVLLTGVSAGGFGAAANYVHVQRAFGSSVPVELIDDSGPFMESPYLAACLEDEFREVWDLDSTVGADCDGHCNNPGSFFLDFGKYVATKYPTRQLGLLDSVDDGTISIYFGFGADDCMEARQLSATTYGAGMQEIRTQFGSQPNLGTFYFAGTDHTSFADDSFYERATPTADGGSVELTYWVAQFLAGHPSNVGP